MFQILRFDNAFKSKSASDVGAILEYLNYSTPNTEITERLKQFVEVILDKSDAFSKGLFQMAFLDLKPIFRFGSKHFASDGLQNHRISN